MRIPPQAEKGSKQWHIAYFITTQPSVFMYIVYEIVIKTLAILFDYL